MHGLVFENIQAIKCDSVPLDIDDTVAYEIPIGPSGKLTHCKDLRTWGYAQSSKSKEFKNGPRLLFSCIGGCCSKNINCRNISNFGVNLVTFQKKDDQTICSLCGDQAFIPCTGRLILEKDTFAKNFFASIMVYTLVYQNEKVETKMQKILCVAFLGQREDLSFTRRYKRNLRKHQNH